MTNEQNTRRSSPADDRSTEANEKSQADKHRERQQKHKEALDETLDHALEDSFPGSDPVAVIQPPPSARDKRRP